MNSSRLKWCLFFILNPDRNRMRSLRDPFLLFLRVFTVIAVFSLVSDAAQQQDRPNRRPIPPGLELPVPSERIYLADEAAKYKARTRPELLPEPEEIREEEIPGFLEEPEDHIVYRCFFDGEIDVNQDRWPDGWTRISGIGYPQYTQIGIESLANPINFQALRIHVERGGALLKTPKIPVVPDLSYSVSAFIRSEGLQQNRFCVQMSFFDSGGKLLKTFSSTPLQNTQGWRRVELGPISAEFPNVSTIQLAFHLIPGRQPDLSGTVDIAGIELRVGPTVQLSLPNRDHVFFSPRDIEVRCRILGLPSLNDPLRFYLEDPFGNSIDQLSLDMRVEDDPETAFVLKSEEFTFFEGRGNWILPITNPGFYQIRVETTGLDPNSRNHRISLAVMNPEQPPLGGDYGWSLPGRSFREIRDQRQFLAQSGISWLKIPCWFEKNTTAAQWEEIGHLCEWFTRSQNISLIGLLSDPPTEVRARITTEVPSTAGIFSLSPEVWYPTVEPTLLRLALIRYWQFGTDEDKSIFEIDPLVPHVDAMYKAINRIAIDSSIGFGWDWNRPIPDSFSEPRLKEIERSRAAFEKALAEQDEGEDPNAPNPEPPPLFRIQKDGREFLSLSSRDPLTHLELLDYLRASENSNCDRFVVLRPISREDYSLEDRAVDLVQRMLTAKIHGAKATFIPEPRDDDTGLLNEDGTPGELFLPWRTTALMVSGKETHGSLSLPNGSENLVFTDGRENGGIMVLWNEDGSDSRPIHEVFYGGPDCEWVELWGKRTQPFREGKSQIIPVGRIPRFITGLNMDVVRFRQNFSLARKSIPSEFGPEISNGFTFINTTQNGIGGTITLVAPPSWKVSPDSIPLNLGPGESLQQGFQIELTPRAVSGPQPFQFDVKLEGVPNAAKEFSIYEQIHVGEGDIYLEPPITRLLRSGELEVRTALVNDTDRIVSFRLSLQIEGRQDMHRSVHNHGFGRKEVSFRYSNGRPLIGKTMRIRAKEGNTRRTIRHVFQVNQ